MELYQAVAQNMDQAVTTSLPEIQEPTVIRDPYDDECILYKASNYGGDQLPLRLGSGSSAKFQLNSTWDNTVSSWMCGQNVKYEFCRNGINDDCTGSLGIGGAGAAHNSFVAWNDETSSVRMSKYDRIGGIGAVTLFSGAGCYQNSGSFDAYSTVGKEARYVLQDLIDRHLCNDCVSSVMVPLGYTLKLYAADGFGDPVKTVYGEEDAYGNMKCQDVNSGFNDVTSSVGVIKNKYPYAQGSWKMVGTGHSTYTFTWGFQFSGTEEETHTQQTTLQYQTTMGTEFDHETVSKTYQDTITKDVAATFSVSKGTQITKDCPTGDNPNPSDPAVGYWVWTVTTADGVATAVTDLGVCRYNEGYWNVEPACPFEACIDYQCKKCNAWY